MSIVAARHFDWRAFDSRAQLAEALATRIVESLGAAVSSRGTGFIAVSGGTTPRQLFQTLSGKSLDWGKVIVTLIDERFVDAASPRSNAKLVEDNLLRGKAAAARFVGLYEPADHIETAALDAGHRLAALPWPLDVAILGMGADGHTASFFPDAGNLDHLLDPAACERVAAVHAQSAGEPRLTLTLPAIVGAGLSVLHIEGAEKREAFDAAFSADGKLPVRRAIEAARHPVQVYWAP